MKGQQLYFGILLLLNCHLLIAQSSNYDKKITTHIELTSDTLLLGQPAFIYYVLNNNSKKSIFVQQGGNYRNGRKNSFNVFIITSDNDTLEKRELVSMGGIMTYSKIKPKESKKYKLFLPMWGNIEKTDKYKLSVSKKFAVAPNNPFATPKGDNSSVEIVPKESSTILHVIEDHVKLGNFITNMVDEIKEETQGRLIEGGGFKTGEKSSRPISDKLSGYLKIIRELKDDRIIPFLVECYKENKHLTKTKIINYLKKHSNKKGALEILLDAAIGEENSKSTVLEDSIIISWSSGDTRQSALKGIMQSDRESAFEFLLAKKNDDYPHERYMTLILAKRYWSAEKRMKFYNSFLDDNNMVVARKAREELGRMKME